MMIHKSLIPLLALVGFWAVPTIAQHGSAQSLQVSVGADGDDAKNIVGQLNAKIGSTMRYSIGSVPDSSLILDVSCIPVKSVGGESFLGYACSSQIGYFPPTSGPLHSELMGDTVLCDRSGEYCAEGIFENFVEETQPDKLKAAEKDLAQKRGSIYAEGYVAGWGKGWADATNACGKSAPKTKQTPHSK